MNRILYLLAGGMKWEPSIRAFNLDLKVKEDELEMVLKGLANGVCCVGTWAQL